MSERIRRIVGVALDKARRSTTPEGERSSSLANALRLIEQHKLDPDDFDIPGRTRTKPEPPPASRFRDDLFTRARSPFAAGTYTRDDFADTMRRFAEEMQKAQAAEFNRAYRDDASDFVRGYRARAEREAAQKREREVVRARRAADFLSARGWRVYPAGVLTNSTDWLVEHEDSLEPYSSESLIRFAERHGFRA